MNKAIVIGSGIAGLASALRLRKKGFRVQVFEAAPHAGGKLHAFEKGGYRFDYGPSLFTMPHLVDELFELFDKDPTIEFPYLKKENVCNYFWEDGLRFSVSANEKEFIHAAAETFGESRDKIESYMHRNAVKYEKTAPVFLGKSLHKWSTFFSTATMKALGKMGSYDLNNTLNGVNSMYFKNPKLVQLFNRYATYNGSSPYKTPGIMSMIPHLEMHYGTFLPKNGMHDISQSLYRLAKENDIEFRFNEKVDRIIHSSGKASAVETEQGHYNADIIVSNMDIYSTYHNLLPDISGPTKTLKQERSSSALIFYWGVNKMFPELDLHNILFSSNYETEFDYIFNRSSVYEDPTVYINITSKDLPADAPAESENWFVMVNTPGNTGQEWGDIIGETRQNIINKVNRILGTNLEQHIEVEEILDPIRIESDTYSHQGSLYGTSSNSRFAAFLRHPNFSGQLKNVYFCGGSVHPGGGIPLCLMSAKITTDMIHYAG